MKIKCSSSIADPYLFERASRHHFHHLNLLFAKNKVQFFILRNKSGVLHGDVFLPTLFFFTGACLLIKVISIFFHSFQYSSASETTRIRLQSFCSTSNKKLFFVEVLHLYFSNSSIIHKENTKEIHV